MRSFRIPIFILLLTMLLCLYAGSSVARHTDRWKQQLQTADDLATREQWPQAEQALTDLYNLWQGQQEWLHMVIAHQELDETEALLQRCITYCRQREGAELLADMAELRTQFTLLDEMQRLTLRNIL